MNKFVSAMEKEENVTYTENGAITNKSTMNYCLDLFALGSSCRNLSNNDKKKLLINAFNQDPLKTMKILFYIRDIRGGSGERDFFRMGLIELMKKNKDAVEKNIKLVPHFGRWDDLYVFHNTPLWHNTKNIFLEQIRDDIKNLEKNEQISLLGKWLKSENCSSRLSIELAKETRRAFNMSSKEYRKTLSKLRNHINLIETKLTKREYASIDYSKVPSRAGYIYRNAFMKNDETKYKKFLEDVNSGEKKMNVGTLYPHEIVQSIYQGEETESLETMWKSLPDYINEENRNALIIADVSPSMNGVPKMVSIAMALYFTEKCEGTFKDYFITFSEEPEIIKVLGKTIVDKIRNISRANWGGTTNLQKTFDLILNMAIKNKVPKKDMPKIIYLVSDMQFNQADKDDTNFNIIKKKYKDSGYKIPTLVFWNVRAEQIQMPAMNEKGVVLVSGFSPSVFKSTVTGETPEQFMDSIIESERYSCITI